MTIRVLVVDDHPVVREGLRAVMSAEPDITVVAECDNGADAVRLAAETTPDVVLMDLRLPGLDGVEATSRISRSGSAAVLVLTMYDTDHDILRAVAAGAAGYLLKDCARHELAAGVRTAARGETVLAAPVAAKLVGQVRGGQPALTRREIEVLECVARGLSNPGDRAGAVHQRDNGEESRDAHLRQARREGPHGRRHRRDRPRDPPAAREPVGRVRLRASQRGIEIYDIVGALPQLDLRAEEGGCTVRSHQPDQSGGPSRSATRRPRRALALLLAATLGVTLGMLSVPGAAQAHGTIVDPASRAYQCWETWGSDHTNPAMEQEDPMCWQAFQANPDTMWNWMSALRDGLGGNFEGATPNGQLCSNALSRNDSLNQPGPWRTTNVSSNFSIHLYDQASHGADFFRVYVSSNGFDPTAQSLGWGDLDFITETGSYPPANDITFNVSTSGYSGHHILFVIWQASHLDQAYMWCSDVNFV